MIDNEIEGKIIKRLERQVRRDRVKGGDGTCTTAEVAEGLNITTATLAKALKSVEQADYV